MTSRGGSTIERTAPKGAIDAAAASLPLFQKDELNRLQQRRDALLKRLQNMPKYTPGRPLVMFKLQQVTAEVMRLELELYGRPH